MLLVSKYDVHIINDLILISYDCVVGTSYSLLCKLGRSDNVYLMLAEIIKQMLFHYYLL